VFVCLHADLLNDFFSGPKSIISIVENVPKSWNGTVSEGALHFLIEKLQLLWEFAREIVGSVVREQIRLIHIGIQMDVKIIPQVCHYFKRLRLTTTLGIDSSSLSLIHSS
jgi:hypothetical protein